jgi:hypothetical protein
MPTISFLESARVSSEVGFRINRNNNSKVELSTDDTLFAGVYFTVQDLAEACYTSLTRLS